MVILLLSVLSIGKAFVEWAGSEISRSEALSTRAQVGTTDTTNYITNWESQKARDKNNDEGSQAVQFIFFEATATSEPLEV